jgi:alkylated DNA nucleotide flippase Atl1
MVTERQRSFPERVCEVVTSIPSGQTLSYEEVAAEAGRPGDAAR